MEVGYWFCVQLDQAVDRVGVAHHRQHDGVALVDDDLEDIGQNEAIGAARAVVDNAELPDALLGGVDVAEGWRNGEAGGFGREGACSAGDRLLAVVDDLDVALGAGVDVACDLSREVEDEIGKAGGVARDGERGLRVLDVAANVALGIDDLQAARRRCRWP